MSFKLELKKIQIALLELEAANLVSGSIHMPSRASRGLYAMEAEALAEKERLYRKRRHKRLLAEITYLKQQHYIEEVKEGENRLYRLTMKGEYELLLIKLGQHLDEQRKKPWDRAWRVIIFDIPERLRKYRDQLRKILKANGMSMWQFSVWVTKYNPEPALYELLKYLGIHKYYALIEADCKKCSPRIVKFWRQMQRKQNDDEIGPSSRAYFKLKKKGLT